jgi:hypothetical protein
LNPLITLSIRIRWSTCVFTTFLFALKGLLDRLAEPGTKHQLTLGTSKSGRKVTALGGSGQANQAQSDAVMGR